MLQEKAGRNAQGIARLKSIWSFVAAAIALGAPEPKDWMFGTT